MMACRGAPTLAVAVALTACAGERSPGAETPVVERNDSAGIEVVTNRVPADAVPVYGELGPPDLAIGVVDGDPAYTFTGVAAARMLPDGGVLVVESRAQELRVFDGTGSHVRTMGGNGSGPGEFSQIGSLAGLHGDTAWVWDRRSLRLSTFLLDGRFLEDRVVEGEQLVNTPTATRFPDGTLLLEGTAFPALDGDATELRLHSLVRRVLPTGALDTIAMTPGAGVAMGREESTVVDGRTRTVRLLLQSPIAYVTHAAVAGEQLFLGDNAGYRIQRRSRPDEVDLVFEAPDLRRRLEPSEYEDLERRRLERCNGEEVCLSSVETSFEQFDAPEWRPAFSDLHVDALGALWVAEWEPFGVPVTGWHVFSTDGELLGHVAVPPGLEVHEIGADYVLGVQESELGVPFVRRFPLTRIR